jgi:hypothetical protein
MMSTKAVDATLSNTYRLRGKGTHVKREKTLYIEPSTPFPLNRAVLQHFLVYLVRQIY